MAAIGMPSFPRDFAPIVTPTSSTMKQEMKKICGAKKQGRSSHSKRRNLPSRFVVIFVTLLVLSCLAFLAQGQDKTTNAKLLETTLVNLHDASLEANKDLDLTAEPAEAATRVLDRIGASVQSRLTKLFEKAHSPSCRALIGEHYSYFINAIGMEESLPFENTRFQNTCPEPVYDFDNLPEGMHIGHIQNRTYQPPRNETEYIDDPSNLKLLYGILTHDNPEATKRLIRVLYEEGHSFVIHVDGKEAADETFYDLKEFAATRDYVHVVDTRVRVNWGGFTMVNATLQILKYAFAIDNPNQQEPLDFDKFVHLASTSYPIASNAEIREKLASFPLDANLMHIIMKPTGPGINAWHYFVECDDALHRIYRLKPLTTANGGVELYTSSQWFVISREFALYLAENKPGTFVREYLEYVEHVVVADETFFGTVLRNTEFCTKHHNWHFLHLQFDRWESDLEQGKRDLRKCMMPDPNRCGRSPTTMTMDYMDILELTGDLFARKFVDTTDSRIKDVLDMKRNGTLHVKNKEPETEKKTDDPLGLNQTFVGHGVMIVAKETVNDNVPLCLGLGPTANQARLTPCFHDWVPKTLAPDWVEGAVIPQEAAPNNRWEFNPCSSDGKLQRLPTGELKMIPGIYSSTGPRCMLKQVDGLRAGRCMDGDFGNDKPGGKAHVFPCVQRWHQFFSVGNGTLAPSGSLHVTIPKHILRTIEKADKKQEAQLCLGMCGRGGTDEDWPEDVCGKTQEEKDDLMPVRTRYPDDSLVPLKKWKGKQLVTTRCSNTDSVVEFLYVPFIVEDLGPESETEGDVLAEEEDEENGSSKVTEDLSDVNDDEEDEL